jgi:hypothetical protein
MDMKIDILTKAHAQQLAVLDEESDLSELSGDEGSSSPTVRTRSFSRQQLNSSQFEVSVTPAQPSAYRYPLLDKTPTVGKHVRAVPHPKRQSTRSSSHSSKSRSVPVVEISDEDMDMRPPAPLAKAPKGAPSKAKPQVQAVVEIDAVGDESVEFLGTKPKKKCVLSPLLQLPRTDFTTGR